MKYSDYIKELGFLPSEIDDLKEYTEGNGGIMSANSNDSSKEIRLFFTKGLTRKITIEKVKSNFNVSIKDQKKTFSKFKDLKQFLDEET